MTNKMKQSVKMDTIPFSGIRKVFEAAGKLIIEKDKASIGMLQRAFKIGFNRAASGARILIRRHLSKMQQRKLWMMGIPTIHPITGRKVCVRQQLINSKETTVLI